MKYLTLLLAGLALTAGQAVAQRPPDTHRGAWFSGGLGGGLMEGVRGGAVYLRVGGTPTERALFGGEVITWFRDAASRTSVAATALLYPFYERSGVPGHDLFFKGSFGVAATSGDDTGVGITLGSGYDFRLGSNFYVPPNVDFLIQFLGERTDTTILFTLGLGLH